LSGFPSIIGCRLRYLSAPSPQKRLIPFHSFALWFRRGLRLRAFRLTLSHFFAGRTSGSCRLSWCRIVGLSHPRQRLRRAVVRRAKGRDDRGRVPSARRRAGAADRGGAAPDAITGGEMPMQHAHNAKAPYERASVSSRQIGQRSRWSSQ
jgi:hypothetical protein